jgi:hypothetical protein
MEIVNNDNVEMMIWQQCIEAHVQVYAEYAERLA